MPADTALDDDYVISLLRRDAEANKSQYSLLPSSRSKPSGAPKPNTRFLRNLVRDADSHNAALKAKEDAERRQRLGQVERKGKRRREDAEEREGREKRKGGEREGRWSNVLGGLGRRAGERDSKEGEGIAIKGRARELKDRSHHRSKDSKRKHKHDHDDEAPRPRHRSRSPQSTDDEDCKHRRRHRTEDVKQDTASLPSPPASRDRKTPPPTSRRKDRSQDSVEEDAVSDPLADIIGPTAPPKSRPRGRGALSSSSAMDSRFNPSYDPKQDVSLDDEAERDDSDMALEALRDRAKFQAQGADRLRAAGFTEEEVSRWERGDEKAVEDVRWAKRGEGREWDRGKTVSKEGDVNQEAEWAK